MARAKKDKIQGSRRTGRVVTQRVEDRAFVAWLKRVFDHPVRGPEWYGDIDAGVGRMSPARVVQYLTWLFFDPVSSSEPFSPAQIGQGLWDLVSGSFSNYILALIEQEVSWEARRECIRAIPRLFSTLFAERCSEGLAHLNEAGENPLNVVCYMWQDLLPTWGEGEDTAYAERDREFLSAMEQILSLRSMACQESALHGLGHWHLHYPQYVEAAIDRFLEEHPRIRPEWRRYAEHARSGCVL